jgi:hypothetical protein
MRQARMINIQKESKRFFKIIYIFMRTTFNDSKRSSPFIKYNYLIHEEDLLSYLNIAVWNYNNLFLIKSFFIGYL